MSSIEEWWAGGEHVSLELSGSARRVFVRRLGAGRPLTLLHGFPSSSHDWSKVAPALGDGHALLMADFLGFGASEKPADHTYTLHEQADLIEALWAREGLGQTDLIAHDYGVSVAQELLARQAEGAGSCSIQSVQFLNGGVYPELHRPQPTQTMLLDPEQGPQISALINEELFTAGLQPTFAPGFEAAADSAEIWRANAREGGNLIMHLLIGYMRDRDVHGERWVAALEQTAVPSAFVWGMLDPVSGAHMAERIRERLPAAPFRALADVGHWPPLEAPERVAAALQSGTAAGD